MLNNLFDNFKKKSLIERFLLVITVSVFCAYFFIGIMVIFWSKLPFQMEMKYRIALGVVLIVYSIIRFLRFYNTNKE